MDKPARDKSVTLLTSMLGCSVHKHEAEAFVDSLLDAILEAGGVKHDEERAASSADAQGKEEEQGEGPEGEGHVAGGQAPQA